jgi:ribonucleoside-diphosphate reductase alpha chain
LAAKATGRRKWEGIEFGCNPCGEILLRSMSFCNLTEVVIRPTDTWADIRRKVRLATILGTLQATLTDFRYLRKQWKKNAEEERLLGVSLTGIEDNRLTSTNGPDLEKNLAALKQICIEVNTEWSDKLGINPAAAVTCIKPSGTVSQLVDCAPGIHDRHSRFVLRATRNDAKDPVTEFLKAMGVPWEPESSKPNDVCVFYFPMKSPDTSVFRTDRNAIQQLELYLTYKRHWTEHNPSCTIYIREHEWLAAGAWVYENFNEIGGISFLPYSEHIYKQAPNTEITKAEYDKLVAAFPVVDWNLLPEFEIEDCTNTQKEPACAGGSCEI